MVLRFLYKRQKYTTTHIYINKTRFKAILADTPTKRAIGLMFRKGIKSNECMLFAFNEDGRHGIWMYNMLFPIDVIWLNSKSAIIGMEQGIDPCKSIFKCEEYAPKNDSRYVIELKGGMVKRLGINRKSKVRL
ncbi:MAG: DUF192 domain-containing protein [Candidatus Micrarchaeaceae archaeon]